MVVKEEERVHLCLGILYLLEYTYIRGQSTFVYNYWICMVDEFGD